jgi:hypothetical protein
MLFHITAVDLFQRVLVAANDYRGGINIKKQQILVEIRFLLHEFFQRQIDGGIVFVQIIDK